MQEPSEEDAKGSNILSTVLSAVSLMIILVLVYFALTYLAGSEFNLDGLLTGSASTRLP